MTVAPMRSSPLEASLSVPLMVKFCAEIFGENNKSRKRQEPLS
jgi:hypothetical protein